MGGTRIGGYKAAETNKRKYGEDFYRKIGAKGGKLGRTGGFWADRELARRAGRIGGVKSRRQWSEKQKNEQRKVMQETLKRRYDNDRQKVA